MVAHRFEEQRRGLLGGRWVGLWVCTLLCLLSTSGIAGEHPTPALAKTRARLTAELDRILTRDVLKGARVACVVHSITKNEGVYRRLEAQPLIPASNQKLLTIALALRSLGEDYHFETVLCTPGEVDAQGCLHGDLWVIGGGDPTLGPRFFDSERADVALRLFVDALSLLGIRRIQGDLVVEDRIFDSVRLGPAWPAKQEHKDYCAPVGGLSLNANCLRVTVRSASPKPRVSLDPPTEYYHVDHRVEGSRQAREMLVALARPDSKGRVLVRGSVGPSAGERSFLVPVLDPALFFGRALVKACRDRSISIVGELRRPTEDEGALDRGGWRELYCRRSPLLPALRWCGKESDNLMAEHAFKRAGASREGQGSFASGGRAMLAMFAGLGIDSGGMVVADGSGLSRDNRISARQMVQLLAVMYRAPERDEFVRSMAIAGVDGTLDQRLKDPSTRYRVRAKTGYLRQVSALSGYAMSGPSEEQGGEVFAFSILLNGFSASNSEMKKVQDDVCRVLVRDHS